MPDRLHIDGSYGEGGGQIVRTAVALAAITGRSIRLRRIRAGRAKPGLGAQHLTSVRAVASVCGASLEGDALGSEELGFSPSRPPQAGDYDFDVAEAREGGSAGTTSLVLQAVLPALLCAHGASHLRLRGGTHVISSPPFDYLADVWLPTLRGMGASVGIELERSGWFPVGRGEIDAWIVGLDRGALMPLDLERRGPLRRIFGRAVAANLPSHVARRMADRAGALLGAQGIEPQIVAERVQAACPGAGIFLTADYETARCGFNAIGRLGRPAEMVAEEAVGALLAHRASSGAVDVHLGDQLLVPAALAQGRSIISVERTSRHIETNAWVIEQFALASVSVERRADSALVTVDPIGGRTARS